jgi:hypothetical protein
MKSSKTTHGKRLGIKPIKISAIRVPEQAQREFRPAWGARLAKDLDLDKVGYPVVNIKGGIPWLMDGQHRIYALKEHGFTDDLLDCLVYENLTEKQMAEVFLTMNTSKAVSAFDRFRVACTAERSAELATYRIVEQNGLHISQAADDGCIGSVTTLLKVYNQYGAAVLEQTLRAIRDGYDGDHAAFSQSVLQGAALVFHRYNGQTNEREMATSLSKAAQGARGLIRRAQQQRDRSGSPLVQCVAAVIVDGYNKGLAARSPKRLPPWWKAAG